MPGGQSTTAPVAFVASWAYGVTGACGALTPAVKVQILLGLLLFPAVTNAGPWRNGSVLGFYPSGEGSTPSGPTSNLIIDFIAKWSQGQDAALLTPEMRVRLLPSQPHHGPFFYRFRI